jgi:hypothetical protein
MALVLGWLCSQPSLTEMKSTRGARTEVEQHRYVFVGFPPTSNLQARSGSAYSVVGTAATSSVSFLPFHQNPHRHILPLLQVSSTKFCRVTTFTLTSIDKCPLLLHHSISYKQGMLTKSTHRQNLVGVSGQLTKPDAKVLLIVNSGEEVFDDLGLHHKN